MIHFDINREKRIHEIISILKLMSLLVCGMVAFTQLPDSMFIGLTNDKLTSNVSSIFFVSYLGIAILIIIYKIWLYSNKSKNLEKKLKISSIIENIMLNSLYTFLIVISGLHESQYKFLFLFMIIANTMQYGINGGITTAIIDSFIILIIDLIGGGTENYNKYFEADLVLSGVFIIVSWLLGDYVNMENQYRENTIQLANIDELTGLYNHRYFQNALSVCMERANKNNTSVYLLFIDIDHFKFYNDLYGHSAGDIILNKFGKLLKNNVRKDEIVARYGGEEFAIILPNKSEKEALIVANRIRNVIENTYFEGEENQPNGKLTISVGISSYPVKAKTKQELINTADDALYRAKFFNKNRVESYYSILEELKSDIEEKHIDIISTIKTLISVINAKDRYTYSHTDRVVIYCELMANHLSLSDSDKKTLRYGAYLHDIGKIQISKDILVKRTKLTNSEWNILMGHPEKGLEIIKPVSSLEAVWPLILYHHERYDGTGYPKGLKKNEIPYLVRILSIADSFDAMTSNRPYRNRKKYEEAIEELKSCSSTQFDPVMVCEFIKMLEKNKNRLDI